MLGKTDSVSVSSWNNMVDDTWGYTRRVAIRPNKPSAFVVELPVSVVAWHFPDRTECRRFFQSAQPKNFPCPALLKRDNRFYHVREGDLFGGLKFLQNKAFLIRLIAHSIAPAPMSERALVVRCALIPFRVFSSIRWKLPKR
jgi:hypothetical protein